MKQSTSEELNKTGCNVYSIQEKVIQKYVEEFHRLKKKYNRVALIKYLTNLPKMYKSKVIERLKDNVGKGV